MLKDIHGHRITNIANQSNSLMEENFSIEEFAARVAPLNSGVQREIINVFANLIPDEIFDREIDEYFDSPEGGTWQEYCDWYVW